MSSTPLLDAASSSCTSKLVPASTARHDSHSQHGSPSTGAAQLSDLGEDARGRRLARAAGAAEQVGVADPAVAHGVAQRRDDVILAPDLAEPAGPVAPVEGLVRHRADSTDSVGGGNLSRPRLRMWRSGPVQLRTVNRVRAGRQQLSADPAVCRRSPGRHLRGRGHRVLEGCESGRIGTLGKRVWGNPPWVRIPLPPLYLCSAPSARFARCLRRVSAAFELCFPWTGNSGWWVTIASGRRRIFEQLTPDERQSVIDGGVIEDLSQLSPEFVARIDRAACCSRSEASSRPGRWRLSAASSEVTPAFFEQLDQQLLQDRGGAGAPSATDFLVLDLPVIVERFATAFDDLPEAVEGVRRPGSL